MAASFPTLAPPAPLPVPAPPSTTDFTYCHPRFGEDLVWLQCIRAGSTLPQGPHVTQYSLLYAHSPFYLPISLTYGDCRVSVEVAGPKRPAILEVRPDVIRGMAGWVLQECVQGVRMGGFVTYGFGRILDYFRNPASDFTASYPSFTNFLTLTISGPRAKPLSPGDLDPMTPGVISQDMFHYANAATQPALKQRYSSLSRMMSDVATVMITHDRTINWWQISSIPPSQMTYTCDSKLGSPTLVDCAHLRNQLSATSDSVQLGPGAINFLSSNTCHLAISATIAITLTWGQIQAALDALTNTCVGHPLKASAGGRAYYELHPAESIRGRKRKRQSAISALSALPDHVKLTIFQQFEPWQTAAAAEMKSCTWKAVMEEKDVRSCGTA